MNCFFRNSFFQPYDVHPSADILHMFPKLLAASNKVCARQHSFEHILELDGPPVVFRPRRLSMKTVKALNKILDDLMTTNN